jgi:hypothetical protein
MERLVSERTRIIRPGLLEIGLSPRPAVGRLTIRSYAIAGRVRIVFHFQSVTAEATARRQLPLSRAECVKANSRLTASFSGSSGDRPMNGSGLGLAAPRVQTQSD